VGETSQSFFSCET